MSKPKKQHLEIEVNDAHWNQRSPQKLVDRLNAEAKKRKCSKNTLVNKILQRHLDLEDYPVFTLPTGAKI